LHGVNSNKINNIIKKQSGLLIRRSLVRIQPGVPIQKGMTRILSWSSLSFWICTAFVPFLIVSRGIKVEQKWNKNISKMKLGASAFSDVNKCLCLWIILAGT
jgi:hypothetical protein